MKFSSKYNLWVMSDPHYNHKNLCRGVSNWTNPELRTRDFNTLEEMNQTMVNNINEVVKPEDTLICLGDWSFGGINSIWDFRKQLNCRDIHLVLGNHDHHIENNRTLPNVVKNLETNQLEDNVGQPYTVPVRAQSLFSGVYKYLEYYEFVMMHYPICSWNNLGKGYMHLFGHLHSDHEFKVREGKAMDVGLDGNGLKPYSVQEIFAIMDKQPICNISLDKDHHNQS